MNCEFELTGHGGRLYQYTCRVCRRQTGWIANAEPATVRAVCGTQTAKSDRTPPHCPHRSHLHRTIPGDSLNCGCSAVYLYRCGRDGDDVTLQPIRSAESRRLIGAQDTHYHGRDCATCQPPVITLPERWRRRYTPTLHRLPTVTLAAIDCVDPDLAAMALDVSSRGIEFADVVLLSHRRPVILPHGVRWERIAKIESVDAYNLFTLRHFHDRIHTNHVLTVQTDGYVLRPDRWQDDWLQFDYIGAPWPDTPYSTRSAVGNSGCCLRSRRWLQTTATLATDAAIAAAWNRPLDDVIPCHAWHAEMVAAGCQIAPPAAAAYFSVERPTKYATTPAGSFAFHGATQKPTYTLAAEYPRWLARQRHHAAGCRVIAATNWYQCDDAARQREINTAVTRLRENEHIDGLLILQGRPTMGDYITALDAAANENDVRIWLNSDCHLDDTAADLASLDRGEFWALARHDRIDGRWQLWDVPYSQDAWAYRGPCQIPHCDILPGTVGCDSALAYTAQRDGYTIANPARSIRVLHLHAADTRTALPRISPPYLHVHPHAIDQLPQIDTIEHAPNPNPTWRRSEWI